MKTKKESKRYSKEEKIPLRFIQDGECFENIKDGRSVFFKVMTDRIPVLNLNTGRLTYVDPKKLVYPIDILYEEMPESIKILKNKSKG